MDACTHIHMHACTHIDTCACTHAHTIHAHTCTHAHTHTHIHMHVHMHSIHTVQGTLVCVGSVVSPFIGRSGGRWSTKVAGNMPVLPSSSPSTHSSFTRHTTLTITPACTPHHRSLHHLHSSITSPFLSHTHAHSPLCSYNVHIHVYTRGLEIYHITDKVGSVVDKAR